MTFTCVNCRKVTSISRSGNKARLKQQRCVRCYHLRTIIEVRNGRKSFIRFLSPDEQRRRLAYEASQR